MANKYQIWDKTSNIITPSGAYFTPEQWIAEYPMAGIDGLDIVIAGGVINGAFFAEYSSFIKMYEDAGCDFSKCTSQQECLDAIEEFEKSRAEGSGARVASPEERIAAALEAQVMLAMPEE